MSEGAVTTMAAGVTTMADNLARWDGERRGVYEVWYATWNDPSSGDGYWLRHVIESPLASVGEPYAEVWFARLCAKDPTRSFGLHRRYPIHALVTSREPFGVKIGPSRLGHDHAAGAVSGDGHAVEWDLRWTPSVATLHQLPAVMYARDLGDTKVLSPNVDVPITGTLIIDGERVTMTNARGGQSHVWGTKHAASWGWAHCNSFDDRPGAALEVLHARLRRRGVNLPPMTIAVLRLPGEELALNRFDQALWSGAAEVATGRFKFRAGGLMVRVEGEFSCAPTDVIRALYHDPDGEERWNHFTALADLRLTVLRRVRGRWQATEQLTATRTAAFELAGPTPDAAVTCEHVAVA